MSELVQPHEGRRRSVQVWIETNICFAESKYGEVLPQAGQGAMDLKKRTEAGDQSQAEKLSQVNILSNNGNFFWSWSANKYLPKEEIIVSSVLCVVWFSFVSS